MNVLYFAVLVATYFPATTPSQDKIDMREEQIRQELSRLQGMWEGVSSIESGKQIPIHTRQGNPAWLFLEGDQIINVTEGREREILAEFTVDPNKNPKTIDMRSHHFGDPSTALGIYEIKGNTLRWCFAQRASRSPPRGFSSTPENRQVVETYRRIQEWKNDVRWVFEVGPLFLLSFSKGIPCS